MFLQNVGFSSQKRAFFIVTTMKTSNLTCYRDAETIKYAFKDAYNI
jgi:hypothetical protein